MNLSLRIARRYLFSRKSTNAINIISGVSVFGLSIGTAALILVLSVFNGFEDLLTGLFSTFNPDVKVVPVKGKTFTVDSTILVNLKQVPGVAFVAQSLEEVAFFEYKDRQDFGILKGVDAAFTNVADIDSTIREGVLKFKDGDTELAVVGGGLRNKLAIDVEDQFTALAIYMPKKEQRAGVLEQPFRKRFAYPVGTFINQQDYDNQYVLTSIDLARDLIEAPAEASAIEIKLSNEADAAQTLAAIQRTVGPDFLAKDRYLQDEAFLKLMNVEKWMSYAILSLMLVLVAFNMIGSLWMVVLEKKQDIAILKSMGATDGMIRNVFLFEGLLLILLGIGAGFLLAFLLYQIQRTFGIIAFPGGFAFEAYPISMRFWDVMIVFATVSLIGLLASMLPARRAMRIPTIIRET